MRPRAAHGVAMAENKLADLAAKLTLEGFDSFSAEFQTITLRAERRFEDRDWAAGRKDAMERLDLYEKILEGLAARLRESLGASAEEEAVWASARPRFAAHVAKRYDIDRAETFFNSATRKMLRIEDRVRIGRTLQRELNPQKNYNLLLFAPHVKLKNHLQIWL